jgi:hypothetical protein
MYFFDAVDNCGGDENDKSVVIITSGITFICFRTKPYIHSIIEMISENMMLLYASIQLVSAV